MSTATKVEIMVVCKSGLAIPDAGGHQSALAGVVLSRALNLLRLLSKSEAVD